MRKPRLHFAKRVLPLIETTKHSWFAAFCGVDAYVLIFRFIPPSPDTCLPSQPNQRHQPKKIANRLGVRKSAWALVATLHRVLIGSSVSGRPYHCLRVNPRSENPVYRGLGHADRLERSY